MCKNDRSNRWDCIEKYTSDIALDNILKNKETKRYIMPAKVLLKNGRYKYIHFKMNVIVERMYMADIKLPNDCNC